MTYPSIASITEAVTRKPRKKRDGNAEARIQAAIVQFIRTAAPHCLVFSVPNGGLRSKSESARLKWTGVVAGIPDLIVLAPRYWGASGGAAFFIECKAAKGQLSPEQEKIIYQLSQLGFSYAVCRSIDDAREAFRAWNIQTREHLA